MKTMNVIAKAQIDKKATRMINKYRNSILVVEPHVGTDGISGLETICPGRTSS
ncbi:hypothetical protein O9992_16340 [Vibrio lentus]|nr:hypothetical protein [Vibrio lentus]